MLPLPSIYMSSFCPLKAGLLLIMFYIINKPFGQKYHKRIPVSNGQKYYKKILRYFLSSVYYRRKEKRK